jgi:hypothetical protein
MVAVVRKQESTVLDVLPQTLAILSGESHELVPRHEQKGKGQQLGG